MSYPLSYLFSNLKSGVFAGQLESVFHLVNSFDNPLKFTHNINYSAVKEEKKTKVKVRGVFRLCPKVAGIYVLRFEFRTFTTIVFEV